MPWGTGYDRSTCICDETMNSKNVLTNLVSSIVLQFVTALSGLILPHFFILCYGSAINGMVSSITQFLSYLALVEAGISAAAIVELYKPLERNDEDERNRVLSAARKFYLQSGVLYLLLLTGLLLVYPIIIGDQVDRLTTVLMILVLAGSNLIDYFILGKYRVLLSADQKISVLNNIQSVGTVLNVIVSIVLMLCRCNVVLVKFAATFIYACRAIFVIAYVKVHYRNVRFDVETPKDALPQRWNALFHQIVGVVCNNTDLILITVCMGSRSLFEASVYYVYNLAASMFTSLANSLSSAITPSFGKQLASGQKAALKELFDNFEFFYFILIFTVYTCMYNLLLPFVSIYTASVEDAVYFRPGLAVLFTVMGLIQNIRIPSLSMICAAGHYKQTQWRAFAEAVINLTVSVLLIFRLGIAGAVIGTICSYGYRSIDSILYNRRFFDHGVLRLSFLRLARNAVTMALLCFLIRKADLRISSWGSFFAWGILLFAVCLALFLLMNYCFEHQKMKDHYMQLSRIRRK